MCTVSFLARQHGYALAMNRDEQWTRVAGLPPARHRIQNREVLAPTEPGGGKWIAVNDGGVTVALVNWYSVTARVSGKSVSRGQVVHAGCAAQSVRQAEAALGRLPLHQINPFRLIGVFPATREIVEWRWDLRAWDCQPHPWKNRQWISSGWDEPAAQRIRSRTFRAAWTQTSAGRLDWLRRLHRSHAPERGPFSTCMHRADAGTVSYTEIKVARRHATLRYLPGTPCQKVKPHVLHLAWDAAD